MKVIYRKTQQKKMNMNLFKAEMSNIINIQK